MRPIALLLAIMMMAGTGAWAYASPDAARDVAGAVEDPPDLAPPVIAQLVAVPRHDHRIPARIEAPLSTSPGREHAVRIFRPPRLVASR